MYRWLAVSDDGLWPAVDDPSVEIEHDHRVGGQVLVADAGRLDRHEAGLGVARADVAAGPCDQAVAGQLGVQADELLADGLEASGDPGELATRAGRAASGASCMTSFSPRPK